MVTPTECFKSRLSFLSLTVPGGNERTGGVGGDFFVVHVGIFCDVGCCFLGVTYMGVNVFFCYNMMVKFLVVFL